MDKNVKKQAALKILGIVTATIGTFLAIPKAAELLSPKKDETPAGTGGGSEKED